MAAVDGARSVGCSGFGLEKHILSWRGQCVRFLSNLLFAPFPPRTKLNPLPQRTNPGRRTLLTRAHLCDLQNAISAAQRIFGGDRNHARRSIRPCA